MDFGDLRALAQRPASSHALVELISACLQTTDAADFDRQTLPYLSSLLSRGWYAPRPVVRDWRRPGWEWDTLDPLTLPKQLARRVVANHPDVLSMVRSINLEGEGSYVGVDPMNGHRHGPERIGRLVSTDRVAGLERMHLGYNELGAQGLELLAESPHLGALVELDLSCNSLQGDKLEMLLHSQHLRQLETLRLGWNPISHASLLEFFATSHPGLRYLSLRGIELQGTAMHLGTAPWLAQLRGLDLYGCKARPLGSVLAACRDLEALNISSHYQGQDPQAMRQVASLSGMKTVVADWCKLGSAGVEALQGAPSLRRLILSRNELEVDAIDVILSEGWELDVLDVGINRSLGSRAAELIAAAPSMHKLQELNLRHCRVGVEGVIALAESPHLGSLRVLNLSGSEIGATGAQALAHSPLLAQLEELDLRTTLIPASGKDELLKSPHLEHNPTLRAQLARLV